MERNDLPGTPTSPCPTCARDLPTRVLADSVTLVVVGVCPEHGTAELSRVQLSVVDPYPSEPSPGPALAPVAYRPGPSCGRHLGDGRPCGLATGHSEPHAA